MLRLSYRPRDQRAVLSWDEGDASQPWLSLLRDMVERASDDTQAEGGASITLPWWSFVGLRPQFGDLLQAFGLQVGEYFQIDEQATGLLRQSARNAQSYAAAVAGDQIEEVALLARLQAAGFVRVLKSHQVRNIRRLAALPAAAENTSPRLAPAIIFSR